ncbi:MAG: DUF5610 domain-containing protein [Gammaproteobacteria bacterium]|nr:DUF5610 domain-containing protein [Gammaproteobacteria bacterium]
MYTALSAISTQNQLLSNNLQQHNLTPKTPIAQADDKVSIGILTPEKTQALLNREIADKLEKYFKDEGIELKGLKADDFTPDKVSERILGFVSGRILSENDNDKQNELMQQARKGIEQGFAEARDILESLSVLNGKVKEDIDSTYDLIQQGLDRLDKEVNGLPADNDQDEDDRLQVQQTSVQNSFSRDENSKIEIITNDGDKILIELFKQQSAQSSQSFTQNEEGIVYSQSRSLSASTGISYQIEGELDEGEQKAIDELLKDVAKVSDQFFSGNVQQAFKKAMEMDFDSSELTRFSLDLAYRETRSTAISAYSEYQAQVQPGSTGQNGKQSVAQAGLKDMSNFIKQMDHLFQNPFSMNKLADSEQGIGDLLKGMNQLLHSNEMKNLEKESSALLDSLVHQLKERYSGETDADFADQAKLS